MLASALGHSWQYFFCSVQTSLRRLYPEAPPQSHVDVPPPLATRRPRQLYQLQNLGVDCPIPASCLVWGLYADETSKKKTTRGSRVFLGVVFQVLFVGGMEARGLEGRGLLNPTPTHLDRRLTFAALKLYSALLCLQTGAWPKISCKRIVSHAMTF